MIAEFDAAGNLSGDGLGYSPSHMHNIMLCVVEVGFDSIYTLPLAPASIIISYTKAIVVVVIYDNVAKHRSDIAPTMPPCSCREGLG